MKHLFASFLLPIFLLAVPAWGQGRMVVDETAVDFGIIEEGQEARFDFRFRNEGDAPLRLTSVQPSCGCTTPSWTQEPVLPGETGVIAIAFDSKGHPGTFVKLVRVTTDGEPQGVKLFIEGFVERVRLVGGVAQGNLLIDAEVGDLGTIPQGMKALHTFRIQNTGSPLIRIQAARASHENVTVETSADSLLSNGIAEVYVAVETETLKPGEALAYTVTLETDDALQPVKTLRLTGKVTGRVEDQE